MSIGKKIGLLTITLLALSAPRIANAEDWPCRLHDVWRSGVSTDEPQLPLTTNWVHSTSGAPQIAWPESPAKHDYFHNHFNMKPRLNFDACFDVAIVGKRVYFGSATGIVHALNATNGKVVWTFSTEAPIRFAPHVAEGKVFVGSDDGYLYCLDASTGALVWNERAGPSDRMIWGNEHMISVWPVRGGPLVSDGSVYWGAGLFRSTDGAWVLSRLAADGKGGWKVDAAHPHQGYFLAASDRIFAPSGKSFPFAYRRNDGFNLGAYKVSNRDGGSWAIVTPDNKSLLSSPSIGNNATQMNITSKAKLAQVSDANYITADATNLYCNTDTQIIKRLRSDNSILWTSNNKYPHSLILAGKLLFAGGRDELAAFDSLTGDKLWSRNVDGDVYGLAVANNTLYASTDTGKIYCFKTDSAPQIFSTPKLHISTGNLYSYRVGAIGRPNPELSVTGLPSWLSWDAKTQTIKGTPLKSDIGSTGRITLTATNMTEQKAEQAFSIIVSLAPQDMVSHWKLDDSGSKALDSAGSHDGMIIGTTWVDGKIGGAAKFDNSGKNHIQLYGNAVSPPWTATLWMRRDEIDSKSENLINGGRYSLRAANWNNTNKVGYTQYGMGDYTFEYSAPLGTWVHLAYVATDRDVSLYVDGAHLQTNPHIISCPRISLGNASDSFCGTLDDIRIYNRALTADELLALYKAPPAPTIDTHPQDAILTEGETANFRIEASGEAPLKYQWQYNGINVGSNWASYTTSASLLEESGARITCVVTNEGGSVISKTVTFTVKKASHLGLIILCSASVLLALWVIPKLCRKRK